MPGRAEYQALLAKVDGFIAHVESAQSAWLVCRSGCDGCCRLKRTAWAVEIDNLRRYIAGLPDETQAALLERAGSAAVVAGERCVFLDEDGRCAVYAARPVICRTHGPAIRLPTGDVDWCGLNFDGIDAADVPNIVPSNAVLDLELLNRMLALVNARFIAAHPAPVRQDLSAALEPAPFDTTGGA